MLAEFGIVRPLELALRWWENDCAYAGLTVSITNHLRMQDNRLKDVRLTGSLKHWGEFRQFLLTVKQGGVEDFEDARFKAPSELLEFQNSLINDLPYVLFRWTRDSRRVYTLSLDSQLLLENTSLEQLNFQEIPFPFSCFFIRLSSPILTDAGFRCNALMVTRYQEYVDNELVSYIAISYFTEELEEYAQVDIGFLNQLYHLGKKNQWKQVQSLGRNYFTNFSGKGDSYGRVIYPEADFIRIVAAEDTQIYENISNFQLRCLRICCAVVFYVQNKDKIQLLITNEEPVRGSKNSKGASKKSGLSVTQESQVCSITTKYPLSSYEREGFQVAAENQATGRSMPPHFRCGHWRRPKGKGSDLTAKKSVLVRPTFVNFDKLGKLELPGGSEYII